MPFGCIGYAWIAQEKRSKLADSRVRCRIIGYGDDDDVEEVQGYKVLLENGVITYCKDVKFPKITEFAPLPDELAYNDETQSMFFTDPESFPIQGENEEQPEVQPEVNIEIENDESDQDDAHSEYEDAQSDYEDSDDSEHSNYYCGTVEQLVQEAMSSLSKDPKTYEEAMSGPDSNE